MHTNPSKTKRCLVLKIIWLGDISIILITPDPGRD